MADRVRRTEHIWMFGKRYDFNVYESSVVLHENQYRGTAANPDRKQKNQIVLHYTAGNNPGQASINYWSQHAPVPHRWVCPRYFRRPPGNHNWGTPNQWRCPHNGPGHSWFGNAGRCPVHRTRVRNVCTTPGHGQVRKGRVTAGAQYIVELAQDRLLRPAAQSYSDVIEVVDSDYVAYHGGVVNDNSVGIEISNVGWNFPNARHDAMTGAGADRRPIDGNRWLRVPNPTRVGASTNLLNHPKYACPHNGGGHRWFAASGRCPTHRARVPSNESRFQAYQEEQYLTLILLLRSLCIKHRIARCFLGENIHEKMMRWWHNLPAASRVITRSRLMRFRGILSHMNCDDGKECGGPALHRNRLFRGIIDEWWMPVELTARERPYYMGPFDPQPNVPSYFRWHGGTLHAELFRDANLHALQNTTSYYDMDRTQWYYAHTETAHPGDSVGMGGGSFPIGRNKIWHGGVHLAPSDSNRKVYAAASGTIVAARLGSDAAVEADPNYGSQRFVLIRHVVYFQQEADPGGGMRMNYAANPTYVFSLYMHLASVANIAAISNHNPPWFNYWRRRNVAVDANVVFCPDVEVAVGDWIGACGLFRRRHMIHFELMSREELTVSPWDDARYRAYDSDTNILCNSIAIDRFVTDAAGDGIDSVDILRAARELRRVKSYHKSEWSLSSADDLAPVVPEGTHRTRHWASLRHFMWVAGAVRVCSDLEAQLCNANGFFWHYHPITFMDCINRLILEENGEVDEPDMRNTNVVMQGGFLTQYVNFATGAAVPAAADNQRLRPYDVSNNAYEYRFTRADLACKGAGAHAPGPTPPNATRFNLTLVNALESIRREYSRSIEVIRSHLCSIHSIDTPVNRSLCVLGNVEALTRHANGLAVDIRPSLQTPAQCRSLWSAATDIIDQYNDSFEDHTGEPSRADLSEGAGEFRLSTVPAI